jgi:hypothetical protein
MIKLNPIPNFFYCLEILHNLLSIVGIKFVAPNLDVLHHNHQILMKLEFSQQIFQNIQISNFMKFCLVEAELLSVEGQKGRHDEADSRICNFANTPKKQVVT